MNASTELLIEEALARPPVRHACVFGGEAELLNGLAEAKREMALGWLATDIREIARLDSESAVVVVVDDNTLATGSLCGSIDLALIPAPPDRDLSRRWLALADRLLAPSGILMVAGANREGIRSIIADAGALFGPAIAEQFRRKHRIAVLQRSEASGNPAWHVQPGIAPGTWQEFAVSLRDRELSLATLPGVFAGDRLDAGTSLLLEHLDVPVGSRVLDVGCGVGIIGIVAARTGASHVDLVDANLLAVAAASQNLKRLLIPHAQAFGSDVYDAVGDKRYDLIVSNPPFHRGKIVDLSVADRLIREAPWHLAPDGSIQIVANAFLAYGKRMSNGFRHVETVAATRQYHVIIASDPR